MVEVLTPLNGILTFCRDILDLEKMAHYIFLIVNSVLKGQYNWYVRTKTIRLCLCVYSRLSEDEDRLRLLVDRVTHAVSTATTYEFGYSNQALFLKFGSGYDAGFAFEINVSIGSLHMYSLNILYYFNFGGVELSQVSDNSGLRIFIFIDYHVLPLHKSAMEIFWGVNFDK